MYDSLDTDYIINKLSQDHDITTITHHDLQHTDLDSFDRIIYTSSQVYWYKKYVELNIDFITDKSKLTPSYESLLSHENKAYEYSWLKANYTNALNYKNYAYIPDFLNDNITYPIVIKTPSGSSSRGVRICKSEKEAKKFIRKIRNNQLFSELSMTPKLLWAHHLRDTKANANFIAQECIKNYEGDYRVQVMGDKFFVYYRKLKKNKSYTSGHGSVNHYECAIDTKLLDVAKELQAKLNSPHIIFDFVLTNDQVKVLEFSAIHPSNVALDNCKCFYQFENEKWIRKETNQFAKREDHYVYAYNWAINKERQS